MKGIEIKRFPIAADSHLTFRLRLLQLTSLLCFVILYCTCMQLTTRWTHYGLVCLSSLTHLSVKIEKLCL